MDFAWSDEQRTAQQQARQFAERELSPSSTPANGASDAPAEAPRRPQRQRWSDEHWRQRWRQCAQFGIQGLTTPTVYGGLGLDCATSVYILEGLGRGCTDNGLLLALGAQLWSVLPALLPFASAEQKQSWLPRLARGEAIAAYALTETEAGSDAFHLRTRATPIPGGFRLEGAKQFVTNAPVADVFLVFATTDAKAGYFGLTAFLVPRTAPGLSVGAPLAKMGLESSPMAEVRLDGVELDAAAVVGEAGGGGAILRHSLEWERGCLLVPALGTMARLLDASLDYTRTRRQFGRPIVDFEAVGQQLADMRLRLELSRLSVYQFAWLKDQCRPAAAQASMVKLYLSESYRHAAATALHLHGGYGYTKAYEFEQVWRDAMASSIYSGTTEMQRNLIAESLLAGAGKAAPAAVERSAA